MNFSIIKTVSIRGVSVALICLTGRKPTYYATFFKGDTEQFEQDLNAGYFVINPKYGVKKGEIAIKTTTMGNAEKRFKMLVEGCQNPNIKFV